MSHKRDVAIEGQIQSIPRTYWPHPHKQRHAVARGKKRQQHRSVPLLFAQAHASVYGVSSGKNALGGIEEAGTNT